MKLIGHFNDFLRDTVNLNKTRIERLEGHVAAIKTFLRSSDYSADIRGFSAQGSWAHKTIIKPLLGKEFDADLVMFVDPVESWSPKNYVQELYKAFCGSGSYKEKVGRNTRCVTLDYAGDFHLDVVPCVVRAHWLSDTTYEVCNRRDDAFEASAPEAYTAWLATRNGWVGNNQLRKVTRLVKYLRDHKGSFSAKSILLTTLLGGRIGFLDSILQGDDFSDAPTALRTIFRRLDDDLQDRSEMPVIRNPVLDEEEFNRHWDQPKYNNFRDKIHQYRRWIDEAYEETNRDESIRKWRRVFGDQFAKGEVVKKGADVNVAVLGEARQGGIDVVAAVRNQGRSILQRIPRTLPHVEAPRWQSAGRSVDVQVRADECEERDGERTETRKSGEVLNKNRWLRFKASQRTGLPFPNKDYRIMWRVVNTGRDASLVEGGLRGNFEKSGPHGVRWVFSDNYFGRLTTTILAGCP